MNKEKKQLRKKYLQERLTLSPLQWQEKSKQICQHLSESLLVNNSKIILSYLSFKQEPDLSLLHHDKRKIWGLPRCQGNELIWHQFTSVNDLEIGKYGILEPSTHSPLIYPHQVDLILVPAVGCDRFGYRLGYGGGYYDRLFAQPLWQNIVRMGIIFDFAYVDKLIKESWDKPLDYICTESGIKTPIKEQKE